MAIFLPNFFLSSQALHFLFLSLSLKLRMSFAYYYFYLLLNELVLNFQDLWWSSLLSLLASIHQGL
jgi:hypothetical protein